MFYKFLNQAMKAVGDGDAALLEGDFCNTVKCYLLAMKLDESLCSKRQKIVETPIDAINNVILRQGRDVFENAVCFDLIEAIQDRSYLKPILIKENTISKLRAYDIVDLVGHLQYIAGIRSGN